MATRWLLLLATVVCCAVAPIASQDSPSNGSIIGVVKDATRKTPIAGLTVGVDWKSTTTSDFQGRFVLPDVKPGRHWISAWDLYETASGSTRVVVKPGPDSTSVELYVKPGSTISGRVLDDNSRPLAGITVFLLEKNFAFGEVAYRVRQSVKTDAKGQYLLDRVSAERTYIVLAKKIGSATDAKTDVPAAPEMRAPVLAPTFYPNAPDAQSALPFRLFSGEERDGADIRMLRSPSFCVDGEAQTAVPAEPLSFRIEEHYPLVPPALGGSREPASTASTLKKTSDGTFRVCGLPRGQYLLNASSTAIDGGRKLSAIAPVTIANADIHDVKLFANFGPTVSGEVVWDSRPPDGAEPKVVIGFNPLVAGHFSAGSMSGGISFAARTTVPGVFESERLFLDDYKWDVSRLPEGCCYVKEATYAGVSVLDKPLRVTTAPPGSRLRIVLASDGGFLTARVNEADGTPVSNAWLYVLRASAERETVPNLVWTEDVEDGWAAIRHPLPPGKYLVIAGDLPQDGSAEHISRLWRARPKAKEIEIIAGASVQVTLQLTGLD